uniref:3CxxC-type domain-containing protein n=1 Tax=Plectus sambesii TaxID=2011161 RepID=A0A914VDC5_9BILA
MQQPGAVNQSWLNMLSPFMHENLSRLVQLRVEEQLLHRVDDGNSTVYWTKNDEESRSPISSGYASSRSTPLRSPASWMDTTFDYGSSDNSLDDLLTNWTSATAKEQQAVVVNRQASVAATRALLRQMSNCSSSATLVPSRQGSNASTIGVVRQMSQLNEFDENEIRNVLYQYKKKPGSNYVCHICHVREEHFIQDCPRRYVSEVTTPYQGYKQCYGEFQCTKCKRKWKSTKSWSNIGQACSKCPDVIVFPKKQFPIDKAVQQGRLTSRNSALSGSESSFGIERWSDSSSTGASVFGDDASDRDARSPF